MGANVAISVTSLLITLVIYVNAHPHPPCESITGGAEIVVEFSPESFLIVPEGGEGIINATIYGIVGNITVSISSGDSSSFESLFNETLIVDAVDGNATVTIPIRGRKLSISTLILNITHVYQVGDNLLSAITADDSSSGDGRYGREAPVQEFVETISFTYNIKVSRRRSLLEVAFTYSLLFWLVISYITMGSKMDIAVIWNKLRRPYGVLTGIACQFIIMPLIAFALANSPGITPETAVGLLVIGSCPGGWISNIFSLLMDVDFVLSLTMTFCSSFMALGMMPLNMFIYGSSVTGENSSGLQTPYKDIAMQLGLMLIPVGVGMFISHKSERIAKIFLKCLKPLSCGLIVIALAIGIPSQLYVFDAPWRIYLICFALPFCGGFLGFFISKLLRRTTKEALTISFETGVQNSLLATTVAKLSYPIPEADLIARIPFLVAMLQLFQGTVMIVTYIVVRRVLIRAGKISRPDTGEYRQCDIEGKDSDVQDEDGDEKGDDLRDEEREVLKRQDVELRMESGERNGYVKMRDEEPEQENDVDHQCDIATKARPDSGEDDKVGNENKMQESEAKEAGKPKETENHSNKNVNNNSDVPKIDSTHPSADDLSNCLEDKNGAVTEKSSDAQAERESSI